jgi:hypothetical protein
MFPFFGNKIHGMLDGFFVAVGGRPQFLKKIQHILDLFTPIIGARSSNVSIYASTIDHQVILWQFTFVGKVIGKFGVHHGEFYEQI